MHPLKASAALSLCLGLPLVFVTACSQVETVQVANSPVEQINWPLMPAGLTSGLRVPPGETFNLGGEGNGGFTTAIANEGSAPADFILLRDNERADIATLEPGERAAFRFLRNDAVLIRNRDASTTAQLRVEVRGDTDLAMYYRPNE